jgi:hypothetical protein
MGKTKRTIDDIGRTILTRTGKLPNGRMYSSMRRSKVFDDNFLFEAPTKFCLKKETEITDPVYEPRIGYTKITQRDPMPVGNPADVWVKKCRVTNSGKSTEIVSLKRRDPRVKKVVLAPEDKRPVGRPTGSGVSHKAGFLYVINVSTEDIIADPSIAIDSASLMAKIMAVKK